MQQIYKYIADNNKILLIWLRYQFPPTGKILRLLGCFSVQNHVCCKYAADMKSNHCNFFVCLRSHLTLLIQMSSVHKSLLIR